MDEAQTLLDEHTQKVQGMRASPFALPFQGELKGWEDKLLSMQDILDQWTKVGGGGGGGGGGGRRSYPWKIVIKGNLGN